MNKLRQIWQSNNKFPLKYVPQHVNNYATKGNSKINSICSNRSTQKVFTCSCKTALVIGGAEGIGKAITCEILRQDARNVAIVGLNNCLGREAVTTLNCAFGKNKVVFFQCDIQCKKNVEQLYKKVLKEFENRLDIVVNSAGVLNETECEWEEEVKTNLIGTIYSCVEAEKILSKTNKDGKGGVILNVTGIHGGIKPLPPAPILSAAFGGVVAYTRSFGDEMNYRSTGIRTLSLCTGLTNTNFLKGAASRTLNERYKVQLEGFLCKEERQMAEVVGKGALHVIEYGPNNSVWVTEGSKLYSLPFPDWTSFRLLESQMI